jgi:hypothetical protein
LHDEQKACACAVTHSATAIASRLAAMTLKARKISLAFILESLFQSSEESLLLV